MQNSRERAHVYISGKVQGVAFRDATKRKAEKLDLVGWVSNMSDGRVEAVFEGQSDAVREMLHWCEEGPPQASVENMDDEHENAAGDLNSFEVR
ncbi:acylphosphatase [soil metagenome]